MTTLTPAVCTPTPEGCMTCSRLQAWVCDGVTRHQCARGLHLWGHACAWRSPLPAGRRAVPADQIAVEPSPAAAL